MKNAQPPAPSGWQFLACLLAKMMLFIRPGPTASTIYFLVTKDGSSETTIGRKSGGGRLMIATKLQVSFAFQDNHNQW